MTSSPAVSVVVAAYNHERFIGEALESVLGQDLDGVHLVVTDDGSSDRSADLIRDFAARHPGRITPVLSPTNLGISRILNRALPEVRGRYVAWLGGDDVMLPGKLRKQAAHLDAHPGHGGVYHDAEVFESPSDRVLGLFSELYGLGPRRFAVVDLRRMLAPKYQMLPSTVMVRKEAIPPEGFDERFVAANDYLFFFECVARGGPWGFVPETLARYRRHAANMGALPTVKPKLLEEHLAVMGVLQARHPGLAGPIERRARYHILLEAVRSAAADPARTRALARLAMRRGAFFRGLGTWLFGPWLGPKLADPSSRSFARRVRNLFG